MVKYIFGGEICLNRRVSVMGGTEKEHIIFFT